MSPDELDDLLRAAMLAERLRWRDDDGESAPARGEGNGEEADDEAPPPGKRPGAGDDPPAGSAG